jgi:hypothetical protein
MAKVKWWAHRVLKGRGKKGREELWKGPLPSLRKETGS